MKPRILLAFVALVVSAIGCTSDDRLEDYWPEPDRRTEVYLGGIQEAVVEYWEVRAALPGGLDDLTSALDHHAVVGADGWGNEMRYTRADGHYCVLSAAADSVFGSSDDMAVGGEVDPTGELVQYQLSPSEIADRCEVS